MSRAVSSFPSYTPVHGSADLPGTGAPDQVGSGGERRVSGGIVSVSGNQQPAPAQGQAAVPRTPANTPAHPQQNQQLVAGILARIKKQNDRWTAGGMTPQEMTRFAEFTLLRDEALKRMESGTMSMEDMRKLSSQLGTVLGQIYGFVDQNGQLTPQMHAAAVNAQKAYSWSSILGNLILYGSGNVRSIAMFTAACLTAFGYDLAGAGLVVGTNAVYMTYQLYAFSAAAGEGAGATIRGVSEQILPFHVAFDVSSSKLTNPDRSEGKLRNVKLIKRDIKSVEVFEKQLEDADGVDALQDMLTQLDRKLQENAKAQERYAFDAQGRKLTSHELTGEQKLKQIDLRSRADVLSKLKAAVQAAVDKGDAFDDLKPALARAFSGIRGKLMVELLMNEMNVEFNISRQASKARDLRTALNHLGAGFTVAGAGMDLAGLGHLSLIPKGLGVLMSFQPFAYWFRSNQLSETKPDYERKLQNQLRSKAMVANFHVSPKDPNSRLDPGLFSSVVRTGAQARISTTFGFILKNDVLVHQMMLASYFLDRDWADRRTEDPRFVTIENIGPLTAESVSPQAPKGAFKLELTTERLVYAFTKCPKPEDRRKLLEQLVAARHEDDPELAVDDLWEDLDALCEVIDQLAAAVKSAESCDLDALLDCPCISDDAKDILVGSLAYSVVFDPQATPEEKAAAEPYRFYERRLIEIRTKAESTSLNMLYNYLQKLGQQYLYFGFVGQNTPALFKLADSLAYIVLQSLSLAGRDVKAAGSICVIALNGVAFLLMVPSYGYNKAYHKHVGKKNEQKAFDQLNNVVLLGNASLMNEVDPDPNKEAPESRDFFVGFSADYRNGVTSGFRTRASNPVPRGQHPELRYHSDKLRYRNPMEVGAKARQQMTAAEASGQLPDKILNKWLGYFSKRPGKLAIINAEQLGVHLEVDLNDVRKWARDPDASEEPSMESVPDGDDEDTHGSFSGNESDQDLSRFDLDGSSGEIASRIRIEDEPEEIEKDRAIYGWNRVKDRLASHVSGPMLAELERLVNIGLDGASDHLSSLSREGARPIREAAGQAAQQLRAWGDSTGYLEELRHLHATLAALGSPIVPPKASSMSLDVPVVLTKILGDQALLDAMGITHAQFQAVIQGLQGNWNADVAREVIDCTTHALQNFAAIEDRFDPNESSLLQILLGQAMNAAYEEQRQARHPTTNAHRGKPATASGESLQARLNRNAQASVAQWDAIGRKKSYLDALRLSLVSGWVKQDAYQSIRWLLSQGGRVTQVPIETLFMEHYKDSQALAITRAGAVRDCLDQALEQDWGSVVGDEYDLAKEGLEAIRKAPGFAASPTGTKLEDVLIDAGDQPATSGSGAKPATNKGSVGASRAQGQADVAISTAKPHVGDAQFGRLDAGDAAEMHSLLRKLAGDDGQALRTHLSLSQAQAASLVEAFEQGTNNPAAAQAAGEALQHFQDVPGLDAIEQNLLFGALARLRNAG
jgi:DNA-binding protein YbaB